MLDDNGFGLGESHAICKYLIAAHSGVADHWYPADAQKRAKVDEYLDWHHTHTRKVRALLFECFVARRRIQSNHAIVQINGILMIVFLALSLSPPPPPPLPFF